MYKPDSLRNHLVKANRVFKRDPEKLHIFVDQGNIVAVNSGALSHEYQYRLNISIEDYAGPLSAITVPLLEWIGIHQVELLANAEKRKTGINIDIDYLNNDSIDLLIRVDLTERAFVKKDEKGKITVTYESEPQPTPEYADKFWKLYEGDTLIAEWHTDKA